MPRTTRLNVGVELLVVLREYDADISSVVYDLNLLPLNNFLTT
jgi:hypothetical protein